MKTLFPLFPVFPLFLLFTFSLQAQLIEDWTEPIALTDSTSNNSNPVVVVWQENGADVLYMFYNKYDEPYRQIWSRKISEGMSFEQVMFGTNPDYDYGNPQVLFSDFLIFEWNIYGNYELFGLKISAFPVSGDIFRLTNTEYDENSFFTYNSDYSNMCCWEGEGNIYIAEAQISQDTLILSNKELIDSGSCYDPVCYEGNITWRKVENNESHIYYSEKNWATNQWSDPAAVIDTGNNFNHSLSIIPEFGLGYNLCWQAGNKIFFSDLYGYSLYSPEIPGIESYFEPVVFDFLLVTDNYYGFYSFAGEAESQRDIYISDEFISNYTLNISDDPYLNKYPRLFAGRGNYNYFEIINIWQTEMNGHDVLFGSSARYNVVIGNTEENEILQVNVFPNPFTETLNIELMNDQSENNIIEIFSISGEKLFHKEIQGQANTQQSIFWNPKSEGLNLSEGIYLVKLSQGKSSVVQKVVYSK